MVGQIIVEVGIVEVERVEFSFSLLMLELRYHRERVGVAYFAYLLKEQLKFFMLKQNRLHLVEQVFLANVKVRQKFFILRI